ncbi:allophanate hydrolase, subunit 1 [Vibrio ichthyoenteri ATCC 700023]|uniref:Allophanate hydrolase, subunit 1 n=1 Tax=Vibrio ichthyoenteri ATCC 700023 TaxID=870968 RepID=F9S683_9VIBR|nr:allophanate hydrolase subunit 1 [Vibrio ichthyoenteri]EGU33921.1 allophanate hydrolase, subunit 1 [Vibrio ichthyoenteri ATCC 700023]
MTDKLSFSPVSECALLLQFNQSDSKQLSTTIGAVTERIYQQLHHCVMNVTPSYNTILVDYLPHRVNLATLQKQLLTIVAQVKTAPMEGKKRPVIELPVYYHQDVGPDLARYEQSGVQLEQVIALHTSTIYTVQATGFAPGFAFLGDVVTEIQRERHVTPRLNVPKGSVAIAESKTAVYPCDSPAGWNVIGNCPIALYDPAQSPMTPFSIGDRVQFIAINRHDFLALGGSISKDWL